MNSVDIYGTDSKTAAVNGNFLHCLKESFAEYVAFIRA